MPKQIEKLINDHRSPKLLQKYPRLLRLQFLVSWLMTLRLWHVKKKLSRVITKLGTSADILDMGCGSGELIFQMMRKFKKVRFTGVDTNIAALQTARDYMSVRKPAPLTFTEGDINSFRSVKLFDIIICISVLQYVDELEEALINLKKLLKPGGQILFYIPINYSRKLPGYERVVNKWLKQVSYDARHNANELNENDLRFAAEKVGLRIQENHYVYGTAGKVAYELMSFGQLMILKLPWIFAIVFALVYFLIVSLPAWILMGIDLAKEHRTGNGFMLLVSRD